MKEDGGVVRLPSTLRIAFASESNQRQKQDYRELPELTEVSSGGVRRNAVLRVDRSFT
jgi:hypothetical protein